MLRVTLAPWLCDREATVFQAEYGGCIDLFLVKGGSHSRNNKKAVPV